MLAILAALTLQTFPAPDPVLTRGEVMNWTTAEAAERLLPPEIASTVIDGWPRPGGPPGFFRAFLWTAAAPSGPGVCHRTAYDAWISPTDIQNAAPTATLTPRVQVWDQYAPAYPEAATPERCAELTGWVSTRPEGEALELENLARLIEVITAAAVEAPPPFTVDLNCQSARACPQARAALRDLPLHKLFRISGSRANGIEAQMGPDASGDTWFVRIDGADAPERVSLRRSMVIYH